MGRRFAVEWAEVARTDLDELLDYIEQDEPGAALAVLDWLEQAAKRLESMPLRGGWFQSSPNETSGSSASSSSARGASSTV